MGELLLGLIIITLILLLVAAGSVGWVGRVLVPTDRVGIVRRRYGAAHPAFRMITPYNTRGVQARTLLPDRFTWLFPGLYTVEFVPRVYVPRGDIGIVRAREGRARTAGRTLALPVECDNFQNGEAFLLNGGEQGEQAAVLPGDHYYYINTRLFTVEFVPRAYVPPGTVGLVTAKAGGIRPPDRPFGRHVECDSFQDGPTFLAGGGEQGRQLAVLAGGTYYDINPSLFDVVTVGNVASARDDDLATYHLKQIAIPVGCTGVVVTLDGADPERGGSMLGPLVEGHRNFRLPWVFLAEGGRRGVQQETLSEGTIYALNPWFVRVILVPTRLLILEWTKKTTSQSRNYDAELEQIRVTIQGHHLHVEMSQTLQIPEKSAPKLVSQFGGTETSGLGGLVHDPLPVQRFVERVLGATVAAYFNEMAAATTVAEFLRTYAETRTDLAAQVRNALLAWGVEAERTTLGEFSAEDPSLNDALKKKFDAQMQAEVLDVKRKNVLVEDEIDEIEVRRERRRAALELEAEIAALGPDNVAMIRIIREISQMQVPEYIGGGDVSSYVQALPMSAVRDLIGRLRELSTDHKPGSSERPRLSTGENAED